MSDITFDEFFGLISLLNGSEEDYGIAINNLENLKFNDKEIIDVLIVKSLRLKKRNKFCNCGGLKENYTEKSLGGEYIYNRIKDKIALKTSVKNRKLYIKILLEIMTKY
jgi:hypothetical protein